MKQIPKIKLPFEMMAKTIGKSGSLLKYHSEHVRRLIESRIWLKVIIAMILGSIVGFLLGPDGGTVSRELSKILTDWISLPGYLFLQIVKMIIIPLVFSSIILGIVSSGNKGLLKKMGPSLGVFFILTTVAAIIIGFAGGYLIEPGNYIDVDGFDLSSTDMSAYEQPISEEMTIPQRIVNIFPSNPLNALVNGDMLSVVVFTIIIGIAMLYVSGRHMDTTRRVLETMQSVSMVIVKWTMHFVPFAVFGLITQIVSKTGLSALSGLGIYMLTVIGCLFVLLVFYLLIVLFMAKLNPFKFIANIKNAMLLAFSTSSSAATMPISIKAAEDNLKLRPAIVEFIIPVGATINMAGTALYQAVATIFLAQVFDVHLSITALLLITVVTVASSIGAPSVPGVGIIVLASILATVGIPTVGIAIILGVDRILDMLRTSVNVTGDLVACAYFDRKLAYMFEPTAKSARSKAVRSRAVRS